MTGPRLAELAIAAGQEYDISQCIAAEEVMRKSRESNPDSDWYFWRVATLVAERFPDQFLQDAVPVWLANRDSTEFADDVIKQRIIHAIEQGHEHGWNALHRISKMPDDRDDLRHLILERALVDVSLLDEGRFLERAVRLWVLDQDELRQKIAKRKAIRDQRNTQTSR